MSNVIPLSLINKYKNNKIKTYRQEIVASGILLIDKRVLLIKRGKQNFPGADTWALPCGKVEPLEKPDKAVAREFWEETHIKVKIKNLLAVENYFYDKIYTRTHIIEFIYHVEQIRKRFSIQLDAEHDAYCFAALEELNKYSSLASPRKRAIRVVLQTHNKEK